MVRCSAADSRQGREQVVLKDLLAIKMALIRLKMKTKTDQALPPPKHMFTLEKRLRKLSLRA